MATIKSEFNQFISNIQNGAGSIASNFQNMIKGITGQASASIGSLIDGSVVGINVGKIPEMKDAIDATVKEIQAHLTEVNVNCDPSKAFADPEMQSSVKAYIGGVMEACNAYTSQLLKFADKLTEIQTYYEQNEAKKASTLQQAGTEVSSSVETYSRQG